MQYPVMDSEHKDLFNCVRELQSNPSDTDAANRCTQVYQDHFTHEEKLFLSSNRYPDNLAYRHKSKHDAFMATMRGLPSPVPAKWFKYALNWLTQHIKNTDFGYKNKMPHPVSDPFSWDESFLVYVSFSKLTLMKLQ
jgi:hemerythrin family non-heme iron protein